MNAFTYKASVTSAASHKALAAAQARHLVAAQVACSADGIARAGLAAVRILLRQVEVAVHTPIAVLALNKRFTVALTGHESGRLVLVRVALGAVQ